MRWPFVSRRVFGVEQQHLQAVIGEITEQRDYWRTRCEKLMDQALARAGAISEPTMRDRLVTKDPSLAASMIAALSITEIGKAEGPIS